MKMNRSTTPMPHPLQISLSSDPHENWYQYVKMDEKIKNQGRNIQKIGEVTIPTPQPSKFQCRQKRYWRGGADFEDGLGEIVGRRIHDFGIYCLFFGFTVRIFLDYGCR